MNADGPSEGARQRAAVEGLLGARRGADVRAASGCSPGRVWHHLTVVVDGQAEKVGLRRAESTPHAAPDRDARPRGYDGSSVPGAAAGSPSPSTATPTEGSAVPSSS